MLARSNRLRRTSPAPLPGSRGATQLLCACVHAYRGVLDDALLYECLSLPPEGVLRLGSPHSVLAMPPQRRALVQHHRTLNLRHTPRVSVGRSIGAGADTLDRSTHISYPPRHTHMQSPDMHAHGYGSPCSRHPTVSLRRLCQCYCTCAWRACVCCPSSLSAGVISARHMWPSTAVSPIVAAGLGREGEVRGAGGGRQVPSPHFRATGY